MDNDDIQLLNGIKSKDMAAMEGFYRRHENLIYRFALKKLNNEFDASDIVNTVMMEVWNTADRFEGRSKVSTWLVGIASHRIIDLIRKRKADHVDIDEVEPIPDTSAESDMQKVLAASQTRRFIDDCLAKLSGDHKQVLQLLFFQEANYEDIAQALACSLGTVKSRIYHAKQLLKKCLEKRII